MTKDIKFLIRSNHSFFSSRQGHRDPLLFRVNEKRAGCQSEKGKRAPTQLVRSQEHPREVFVL